MGFSFLGWYYGSWGWQIRGELGLCAGIISFDILMKIACFGGRDRNTYKGQVVREVLEKWGLPGVRYDVNGLVGGYGKEY